jgi:cytochrome P450
MYVANIITDYYSTAGSDSTATVIRMAIYLISTNPTVYQSLMAELDSALAEERISRPVIHDAEARALPYLQACIRETIRYYPPVTGLLAKQAPPEGDTFNGYFIPGGTQIAWNILGILRDEKMFGEEVDAFRPERWLNKSEEEYAKMDETVMLVFGYGRFGCLGRPVAHIEMNKVIAEVSPLNFEHELEDYLLTEQTSFFSLLNFVHRIQPDRLSSVV